MQMAQIVILDVFGGAVSRLRGRVAGCESAINVDIVAIEGIRADARHLPLATGSVDTDIASNPYIRLFEHARIVEARARVLIEVARVLKRNGEFIINGSKVNPYVEPMDTVLLVQHRLRVVVDKMPLDSRFRQMEFYRTNNTRINPDEMVTTIYRKV